MCVLSIGAASLAGLADGSGWARHAPDISADSIETLLSIIAASMLAMSVFAVGAMLSAYTSASNSATPRSFALVIADDVSQYALSTFIGAFIFSIVGLIALLNDLYGKPGRFVLFVLTLLVFTGVILSFVRWVDRIARLGRLGTTIDKVEAAAAAALLARARRPTLGAAPATDAAPGLVVHARTIGYVQRIDVARLQSLAEQTETRIRVMALPGTFATPDQPLAQFYGKAEALEKDPTDRLIDAFVIGGDRTFDQDPRFGLVVLSEIASRALSPGINDPGTAIDIIGTLVRLFVRWAQAGVETDPPEIEFDRVEIPALSPGDLFDDAFGAMARDGAGMLEVAIRLQKALGSLCLPGHASMQEAARTLSARALRHARHALKLPEELAALEAVAAVAQAPTTEVTESAREQTSA
jgi:uncharacterized membrane protein